MGRRGNPYWVQEEEENEEEENEKEERKGPIDLSPHVALPSHVANMEG
jgi:hypothetical protein